MRESITQSWEVYIILLCILLISGCSITSSKHFRFIHSPPLANGVPKIVEGQTTKDEIIKYYGVPDLEVDGTTIILHPETPLGRLIENIRMTKRYHLDTNIWVDEWSKLLPYSSINDEHIVFLYLEIDSNWKDTFTYVPMNSKIYETILRNKMIFFINKKTGLVDEFAYREEFKVK